MNNITNWESAVNFVNTTGKTFIHNSCVLNKNFHYIEIQFSENKLSFPFKEAIKFLNINFPFNT